MISQNSYGETQYCSKCGRELEKARTRMIKKAKCLKCKKELNTINLKKHLAKKLEVNK